MIWSRQGWTQKRWHLKIFVVCSANTDTHIRYCHVHVVQAYHHHRAGAFDDGSTYEWCGAAVFYLFIPNSNQILQRSRANLQKVNIWLFWYFLKSWFVENVIWCHECKCSYLLLVQRLWRLLNWMRRTKFYARRLIFLIIRTPLAPFRLPQFVWTRQNSV